MSRWGAALTCIGFVWLLSAAAPGPAAAVTLPDACPSLPDGEELISGLTTGQPTPVNGAFFAVPCDAM